MRPIIRYHIPFSLSPLFLSLLLLITSTPSHAQQWQYYDGPQSILTARCAQPSYENQPLRIAIICRNNLLKVWEDYTQSFRADLLSIAGGVTILDYANAGLNTINQGDLHFYVSYVTSGGDLQVDRYTRDSTDPTQTGYYTSNVSTRLPIITVEYTGLGDPGGHLLFLNHHLYISVYDNTPGATATSNTSSLYGKILRIYTGADDFPGDANKNYAIPWDNPIASSEVFYYGAPKPYMWGTRFVSSGGSIWKSEQYGNVLSANEFNLAARSPIFNMNTICGGTQEVVGGAWDYFNFSPIDQSKALFYACGHWYGLSTVDSGNTYILSNMAPFINNLSVDPDRMYWFVNGIHVLGKDRSGTVILHLPSSVRRYSVNEGILRTFGFSTALITNSEANKTFTKVTLNNNRVGKYEVRPNHILICNVPNIAKTSILWSSMTKPAVRFTLYNIQSGDVNLGTTAWEQISSISELKNFPCYSHTSNVSIGSTNFGLNPNLSGLQAYQNETVEAGEGILLPVTKMISFTPTPGDYMLIGQFTDNLDSPTNIRYVHMRFTIGSDLRTFTTYANESTEGIYP